MTDAEVLAHPTWRGMQDALDADPDAHWLRGRIGDWLGDHDHPWADGYWWMCKRKKSPQIFETGDADWNMRKSGSWDYSSKSKTCIPRRLLCRLESNGFSPTRFCRFNSRLDAELALCRAIAANPSLIAAVA